MAKQTISLGSSANDGTGDTLRQAGLKINQNFDELYSFIAPGYTDSDRNSIVSPTNGQIIYNTTSDTFEGYANGSWVTLG